MPEESLSRNEVEELLRSMDSGEKKKKPATTAKSPAMAAAVKSELEAKAEAALPGPLRPPHHLRVHHREEN